MIGVRIPRQSEDALFQLNELGPVRCLRDNVFLLTAKQLEALKGMKIPFERVNSNELQEKMKGVVLA